MTIAVHIANGSPQLMDQFKPRYDKMGGFAQFRIPTVITCLSLMMSEVPILFPKLRWAFVEASAQWIPWVVNEAIRRSGTKGFPKNPCKEFKIYITAQTDDDFPYVLKYAGEDNIVIGTDYGHTDASSEVDAIEVFRHKANRQRSGEEKNSRRQSANGVRALRKTDQTCRKNYAALLQSWRQNPPKISPVSRNAFLLGTKSPRCSPTWKRESVFPSSILRPSKAAGPPWSSMPRRAGG